MNENSKLSLGSLFDGSGGFPLGGVLAGIAPLWASEVEPFAIRVTTMRLPAMKHYGDVSKLNGAELPPVDIITFGSPCQDMSVAGRRAGLDGSRSGLFHEAIRIIREMRNATHGESPRYIVWENVPGAFSSNGGADFRSVLEEICRVKDSAADIPQPDKWESAGQVLAEDYSVAWRVLDAQYWGVPQRRKRIFLVADFNGQRASVILFKSEGMSGYSAAGIRAWQRTACRAENGTGETGGILSLCVNPQGSSGVSITENATNTLVAQDHGHHPAVIQAAGFCTEHSAQARSIGYEDEISPTLRAQATPAALALEHNPTDSRIKISEDGKVQTLLGRVGTGGNQVPLVAEAPSFSIGKEGFSGGEKANYNFSVNEELAPTLQASGSGAVAQPDTLAFGICAKSSYAMLSDNPKAGFYEAKTSRTLDQSGGNAVTSNQGGICVLSPDPVYSASAGHFITANEETAQPLLARDYKAPQIVNDPLQQEPAYIVRRLTPTECARLQGFPDWWCMGLETSNPSEAELAFWSDVFETYRLLTNPNGKPKTRNQIVKWLKNPYRFSARGRRQYR